MGPAGLEQFTNFPGDNLSGSRTRRKGNNQKIEQIGVLGPAGGEPPLVN